MRKLELLAPCGNLLKLYTAIHYGADAVYLSGRDYGLRAMSTCFSDENLKEAVKYAHKRNVKVYVTVNIYAKNEDFIELGRYVKFLESVGVDAVIVSDPGVLACVRDVCPDFEIHLSTQANTTNKYAAKFWKDQGVKRIVTAREQSIKEIKELHEFLGEDVEIEAFVHGAMCMSYSGRCLLSSYITGRDGNRGACVQSCRWEYELVEKTRKSTPFTIQQDNRGSYILNSKDLCMIEYIEELKKAGVTSYKIEGRMKAQYYVANVINAYRMALDNLSKKESEKIDIKILKGELEKISHRDYTTGFYYKDEENMCYEQAQPKCKYDFMAEVIDYDNEREGIVIMQRNRFKKGDELEILSNNPTLLNKTFIVDKLYNEKGEIVEDAKYVQQILFAKTPYKLKKYDMLRKRNDI